MKKQPKALYIIPIVIVAGVGWWTLSSDSTKKQKTPPIVVQKVVKEDSLNTLTLTEETEARLGIKIEPIVLKKVQRTRLYSGEIITPVGSRGVVTAPFGGILKAPKGGVPKSGETVTKGKIIYELMPLLTAEARATAAVLQIDADMQVQNATTQFEATKAAVERARKMFADGVGAKRLVEESQAAFDTASKTLEAAKARQKLQEESLNQGSGAPILITAPEDGVLRKVFGTQGQNVQPGAALFEIGSLATAWVRVPLPMGDLGDIARDKQAQIGSLSARADRLTQVIDPVVAPPFANPQLLTVDLLYVLHTNAEEVIPGQRIGVQLPLANENESIVIPSSAVVFDALGGSWVYEQIAPLTYARKRITLSYILGGDAILTNAPAIGAQVVSAGAQALFGAETGTMK